VGNDGNEVGALDVAHIDLVLYSVVLRGPDGRAERLVLRRTVFVELDDDTEAWVEELWISDVHRCLRSTAQAVRAIGAVGTQLVLGKPLEAAPGMKLVTSATMPELAAAAATPGGRVDLLVVLRGHLCDLTEERRLTSAEVSSAATFVGRVARELVVGAITALQLCHDDSGSSEETEAQPDVPHASVARQALTVDLGDAKVRLQQEELWARIAGARLAVVRQPAPAANATSEPVWLHWERQMTQGAALRVSTGAEPALDPAVDAVVAVFIGVEGGQIGDHNEQFNLFRYRLEPTIDLRAVLGHAPVQAALARFAASEGDPSEREAAIDAVRSARNGGRTDWGHGEPRVDPLPPPESGSFAWLSGTVVICDCRGIQVGNHLRQYNTFSSVLAPTIDACELFRENPDLVETIVDYACGGDGRTHRTVQDRLAEAVCGSADTALARPADSALHPYGSTVCYDVGQMVGRDIRQHDVLDLAARVPAAAVHAVERARSMAEVAAREEAEKREKVAAREAAARRTEATARQAAARMTHDLHITPRPPDLSGPSMSL
jgi:RIP homotypic interaction motif